ncbi:MAG TPA: phosphoesterase [Clostridiales bacterium]|jgi:phosphoesterase recJ domain protein|nr:DHH family phosphoesterase [Clostridium sp.]MEE1379280.1 DHH family phosphoesterase [Clostridia bacterium]CDE55473.1 putative signaling protein consisting of a modified GGDEF domain and a DHH domain protein [Clostridium sp. CAG:269]HCQ54823.1 phosphoesterase [Clostridiales bacterium]
MSENNSRKVFDSLVSRTKIYLVIILILFILISVFRPILIIPSIILYISILCYTYFANNKRKSEISEQLQDLTLTVDSAAKSSLINSPFPLVILETNGNIVWKSSKFVTEFADIDMDNYIDDLIIDIKDEIEKSDNKKRKSVIRQIQIGKKTYTVQGEFAKSKKYERKKSPEYMMILYFIDETEKVKLKQENEDKKICVGIIMIDNYEEVTQRVDAEQKTQLMAKVESTIYDWVNETNGILVKADRDTYVYVFEQKNLEKIKEEKFAILDSIKNLVRKDKIQLTLSIAISNEGDTERDVYKSASAAMDVILGRGGDQAVIRQNGKYLFFGGKVEEVEKRTKVKARIVAHALEELIKENDKIMIMGHTNPDIDAIGSALGIYRIAKTLEKEAKIVANVETPSIKDLYESIKDQYQEVFISSETALAQVDSGTLIIVVDTHKKTYVESPELLTKTNKIVIIDHHRRSADFIDNSILTFQEVYASSAAELVTEIIQYTQNEVELSEVEAEALYAGIMMDTKNFTFKTGVRTFEAAAYLRRCGVDIIKVKKWFQSDLESYNTISEIVRKAEIVRDSIGISIYDVQEKETSLICAKAADELLTIGNITASFVLGLMEDGKVCISGRSIGDVNVQMILEKLGGGGHITLAGAQLENVTIDEAKQELISKINEYFEEKE